jgi:hypothetical protein
MQVIAAAVQWLVAVNEPLSPVTCCAVLDYLSQQLLTDADGKQEVGTPAVTGGCGATYSLSSVWLQLPHHTATLWCLAQKQQHRLLMLQDGRWAQLLAHCVPSACHRLRRQASSATMAAAPTALIRDPAECGRPSSPVPASAAVADAPEKHALPTKHPAAAANAGKKANAEQHVPLLPLQHMLQNTQHGLSNCTAGHACPSAASDTNSSASRRASAAVRALHMSLQTCWLLLQQDGAHRKLYEELPAEVDAVYALGASSWWSLPAQHRQALTQLAAVL